ncbi:hypothetical protein Pfo_010101 [Paulownia fortunei]|nr:hypothetical protein Pfo_010101 [Paulownia fortunei]
MRRALQTIATAAGVFSAVSFWYGFIFGRESAELGHLIEILCPSSSGPVSTAPPPPELGINHNSVFGCMCSFSLCCDGEESKCEAFKLRLYLTA